MRAARMIIPCFALAQNEQLSLKDRGYVRLPVVEHGGENYQREKP